MCICDQTRINPNDPRREWWTGGSFEATARKICGANEWRVWGRFTVEDLVQESFLHFEHLLHVYPQIQEPRHLMGIFKQDMAWAMIDVANLSTKLQTQFGEYAPLNDVEVEVLAKSDEGRSSEFVELRSVLFRVPEEIRTLLLDFIESTTRVRRFRQLRSSKGLAPRESTTRRLYRLLNPNVPLEEFRSAVHPLVEYLREKQAV